MTEVRKISVARLCDFNQNVEIFIHFCVLMSNSDNFCIFVKPLSLKVLKSLIFKYEIIYLTTY